MRIAMAKSVKFYIAISTLFAFSLSNVAFAKELSNRDRDYFAAKEVPITYKFSDGRIEKDKVVLSAALKPAPKYAEGNYIVIDTRDQESCKNVQRGMSEQSNLRAKSDLDIRDLCIQNPEKPYSVVMVMSDTSEEEFQRNIDLSSVKSTEKNIVNETRNLGIAMVGFMGLLYMMPSTITNWDKDSIQDSNKSFFHKYRDNVKSGPVWDKDDAVVNYIGHPVAGAAYYVMARHSGLSKLQSFGYSVLMSTFFWEYGFEALAEIPSIQDIIITPVIGSLLGELFYTMEESIIKNNGVLWGSKKAGAVAMVILNPMGSLSSGINKVIGSKFIQSAEASVKVKQLKVDPFNPASATRSFIGVEVKFSY